MTSGNEEIMFEIGVAEHPQVQSRLAALAKSVLDAQSKMTSGIERVALAAGAAGSNLSSVSSQMKTFRDQTVSSYDDIRGAVDRVHAIAAKQTKMVVDVVVRSSHEAARKASSGGGPEVAFEIPSSRSKAPSDIELPSNMRNVFKELGDAAGQEADRIKSQLEGAVASLPSSVAGVTHKIKAEYEKRVAAQAQAFSKMADDLDAANATQSESSERMNANVVKGTRSVIGAARGFATLGIAGEESTEALLQGLAKVQGAFDILDGAVDLIEAVNGGWKAMRASQDAVATGAKIQKAMMGGQFAQLQAYQLQLGREAVAANIAAAANTKLNASRGVGGAAGIATQAVGSAAVGVGAKAATAAVGAAGAASAGGAGLTMGTTLMGAGVGLLGLASALGAALASTALAVKVVSESVTGSAQANNSWTMAIAKAEVSAGAWALEMTGMQTIVKNNGMLFGGMAVSIAELAESNIALAKAQKKFAQTKIDNETTKEVRNAKRSSEGEVDSARFERDSSIARMDATVNKNESGAMREAGTQAKAGDRLAELQKTIDGFQSGSNTDLGKYAAAVTESAKLQTDILNSIGQQQGLMDDSFTQKLTKEAKVQSDALAGLAKYQAQAAEGLGSGAKDAKAYENAVAQVKQFEDAIKASKEKQLSLTEEQAKVAIDGASRVQESLKKQLDTQTASLDRLRGGYQSMANNFAKLGRGEQDQVKRDLAKGRASGGASLDERARERLEKVGGSEATRLVNEGRMADAKKAGLDQSFGSGFANEEKALKATQSLLTAKIDEKYEVKVDLKMNAEEVAGKVKDSVKAATNERFREFEAILAEKLGVLEGNIRNKATAEKLEAKSARR